MARCRVQHLTRAVQAFLERSAKEEPQRLEGMRVALEAALKRLIGRGAAALLVPEGDSWSWGVDLPAAGYLLQVHAAAAAFASPGYMSVSR